MHKAKFPIDSVKGYADEDDEQDQKYFIKLLHFFFFFLKVDIVLEQLRKVGCKQLY